MKRSQGEPIATALRRSRDDAEAFARVYAAHADALLAFFMRRVLDVEVALDLMAETLARAFLHRRRFRGSTDTEAAGWIYAIAGRQLASYFRHQTVERRALKRMALDRREPIPDAETRRIEKDTLKELEVAARLHLDRLSVVQREAVQLRIIDELDYAEIARRLSVSEEAARARVARGLRALRESARRDQSDRTQSDESGSGPAEQVSLG